MSTTDLPEDDRHPITVIIRPGRAGPRIQGDPRPVPGHPIALDLTSIRWYSPALARLAEGITEHAPRVLVHNGTPFVRLRLAVHLNRVDRPARPREQPI